MEHRNVSRESFGALRVAELARVAGVTPATVRYYARIGLLQSSRDPDNTYRHFSRNDLRRVQFIRRAQHFGLTINDIKDILSMVELGENPCVRVRFLIEQRLQCIHERVLEYSATERRIRQAMDQWDEFEDDTAVNGEICPLIERLEVG